MTKSVFYTNDTAGAGSYWGTDDSDEIYSNTTRFDHIYGGKGNDTIIGSSKGTESLYGEDGDDTLDGGKGSPSQPNLLSGGDGNDTYIVHSIYDLLYEAEFTLAYDHYDIRYTSGIDTVKSYISFSLTHEATSRFFGDFENLILRGTADIDGSGNAFDNILGGNTGSNILRGFDGNDRLNGLKDGHIDTLYGGKGDDTYIIDEAADVAVELAGEGTDTVMASVTFQLTANIENLTLTGKDDLYGMGNAADNVIRGNDGYDQLWGLGGNDTLIGGSHDSGLYGGAGNDTLINTANDFMSGGQGDDTYIVSKSEVTVFEGNDSDNGTDSVRASISFSLADTSRVKGDVENLTLTGKADIDGTGNGLNNLLIGNSGDNVLKGLDGNDRINGGDGGDTLAGGKGADVLTGGKGADHFVFDTAPDGMDYDNILDFNAGGGSYNAREGDRIELDHGVFAALSAGALKESDFGSDNFRRAAKGSEHIIYNKLTGDIYYDADGAGGAAAVRFAHVTAGTDLHASDFAVL